jgi:hypothetical protein
MYLHVVHFGNLWRRQLPSRDLPEGIAQCCSERNVTFCNESQLNRGILEPSPFLSQLMSEQVREFDHLPQDSETVALLRSTDW